MMTDESKWITVKEAAEKADVTTQAIYKKLKHNELQTGRNLLPTQMQPKS